MQSSNSALSRSVKTLLVLVAIVLFTFFQRQGAVGVRGTDQYWYVQDTERVASGKSHTTNAVFPNSVMVKEADGFRTPFIHNTLPVYLAALFTPVAGAYKAWLVANWLGVMLIAAAGALTAHRLTGSTDVSIAAFCAFLCFPLTVWEASQPLAEILTALPIALALVFVSRPGKFLNWIAVTALMAMAFMSRESYLIATLLIPAVYLGVFGLRRRVFGFAAGLFLVALLFIPVTHFLFPPDTAFCPPLLRLLANTPYADPMVCFYETLPAHYPAGDVIHKVALNLLEQVVPSSKVQWLVYIPFWAMVAMSARLIRNKRPEVKAVLLFTFTLLLTHCAEIVIYQDQFRYKQPILMEVLVCGLTALVGMLRIRPSGWRWGTVCLLAGSVLLLSVFEKSTLGGAASQIQRFSMLRSYLAEVPEGNGIVVGRAESYNPLSAVPWAAEPRPVLHIDPLRLRSRDCELMAELKVRWVLASPGEPLLGIVRHSARALSLPEGAEAGLGAIRLWPVESGGRECPLGISGKE